jgi:hypothetical protein
MSQNSLAAGKDQERDKKENDEGEQALEFHGAFLSGQHARLAACLQSLVVIQGLFVPLLQRS